MSKNECEKGSGHNGRGRNGRGRYGTESETIETIKY